ncbi:MAG: ABC transporter permease [SAR324 cluster bacterium]|nr:ABC transporter permease [SAR324 cluster bacterium]
MNFLKWTGRTYLVCILLFLYVPILVMIALSFNESQLYRLPIEWSSRWYEALANNRKLHSATLNSLTVALLSTCLSTLMGTAVALAFFRYHFRAKRLLQILIFPPITIPWLIIGTAMLVFFFWVGIGRGLHAMVLGHVALSMPYVVIVVSARLKSFDSALEDAARSLGASYWQTTLWVTVPWLMPGIIAAALFAFAVSLDQFVISYFLAAPGVTTLPVEIYTAIRKGFTPEINAISTLVIILSMLLLLGVSRFYRFGGRD